MRLYKFFRANDWWEPKLTPLLAMAYATAVIEGIDLLAIFPGLLLLILIFIVVAVYVSAINDSTDVEVDLLSGKKNRLAAISFVRRLVLVLGSLLLSFLLIYLSGINIRSVLFAVGVIICFSLYSLPPFRLKNRGFWGIIADASGAHLFPTLFFVSSVYTFTDVPTDATLLTVMGIWSFAYGMRGILWHQFRDKDYDTSVGLKTFVTNTSAYKFKPIALFIILVEFSALAIILFSVNSILPILTLGGYLILLVIYNHLDKEITLFAAKSDNWYILMTDYYQVLLPLSLIILASFTNPACLFLLIFHLLFFPNRNRQIALSLLIITGIRRAYLSG